MPGGLTDDKKTTGPAMASTILAEPMMASLQDAIDYHELKMC